MAGTLLGSPSSTDASDLQFVGMAYGAKVAFIDLGDGERLEGSYLSGMSMNTC